jgi:cathepsin A (carboxypeptidase C)
MICPKKMILCLIILLNLFRSDAFSGSSDEVKYLPGLDFKINYRHYSGYLNSTDGRFLHYWFFESQRNPAEDPVVLWLNGGPGCSSVLGLLTEQGPIHVNLDGRTLYPNDNAWNLVSNVIFLEAPAGVGFSYKNDKQYNTNDDEVAEANYVALQSFFEKFPQFKNNDFYVTGESYGGIYVPTLSVNILRGKADINFKGFAVGNGFLDVNRLGNSVIYFGYFHGLYGKTLWSKLVNNCCGCETNVEKCNFVNNSNSSCVEAVMTAASIIHEPGLNIYNLYADCAGLSSINILNKTSGLGREYFDRKLMLKTLNLTNGDNIRLIKKLRDTPPCIDTSYVEKWINQKDVRENLHIPPDVEDWQACSLEVETGYTTLYTTMKPQVLELLASPKNLKGLIYNGDVDMACNFLGDEWYSYFVYSIQF